MGVKQTIPSSTNAPKALSFAKLRGLDCSTSPFEVTTSRATDMKNIINDDGINHKRQGWSENHKINQVLSENYSNEEAVAVHKVLNDTVVVLARHVVVFNKNSLKKSISINSLYDDITEADFLVRKNEVVIYCYAGINTLVYIVDLLKFNISEYEPYVPTTTVSINSISSETSTRDSLDFANLLTTKITNSLIGNKETEFNQLYVAIDYSNLSNSLFKNTKLYFYSYSTDDVVDFELTDKISSFTYNSATDDAVIGFRAEQTELDLSGKYVIFKIYNAVGEEIPLEYFGIDPKPFTNKISENNKIKVVLIAGGGA